MKNKWKKDAPSSRKASSWAWLLALPLMLVYRLLPHRTLVIVCFVSVLVMLAINIALRLIWKEWNRPAIFILKAISVAAMMNLLVTANYTFAADESPILIVCAILGVIGGAIFTFWYYRHKYKILPKIGLSLCFAVFFWGIAMFTAFHMNYLFDTKPPVECEAVIEDKDINRHRKGPDDYELIVTIDGKRITMEVSSEEYRRYDIGDTYTFYRYQGAFNIPFYFEE
jgi:hypothetical protein